VLLEGPVTEEIVGAVRSRTIVDCASAFAVGPALEVTVPYTEPAFTCGRRVPSLHELTVKVNEVPEAALIEKAHPAAVPAFEKSVLATVFTFCEKISE
jgi:hypothetical protein